MVDKSLKEVEAGTHISPGFLFSRTLRLGSFELSFILYAAVTRRSDSSV